MNRDRFVFALVCLATISFLGCGSKSDTDGAPKAAPPVVQKLNIKKAAPPSNPSSDESTSEGSSSKDDE